MTAVATPQSLKPRDAKDEVSLTVNGAIYRGWTGVSVKQGIKSIAGSFDLTLTDDWTKTDAPWPISPGDECTVKIGTDELITGWVDDVEASYDSAQHSIRVAGRDATGDLVDCSAAPGQYRNLTLLALATKLLEPFGIGVIDDFGDATILPAFAASNGETVFEILDKAARQRGCLLYSDGLGSLVLGKPGVERCGTALVEGKNIFRANSRFSAKERHSVYRVVSQFGGWKANMATTTATGIVATATDAGVKRYRPLNIVAETNTDTNGAQRRASFEASTRRGKSQPITLTVEGHRQADGALWAANFLVQVKAPWLGIFTPIDLLIVDADYVQNDTEGTVTTLEVMPADAMQILKVTQTAKDLWKNYAGGAND